MNSYLTRTAIAVSSVVLVTGCGPSTADNTTPVPQEAPAAVPDGTYDGWAVRAAWDDVPTPCPYSPDQVERLLESDAPVPACIRRLQRWFETHYAPPPASANESRPGCAWAGGKER